MDFNSEQERQRYFIEKLSGYSGEILERTGKRPSFFIQTFGCQMNERDSEKLAGILESAGFIDAGTEEEADLILYNTCTVRDNADQRVFGRLGVLKGLKDSKKDLLICLSGCMMQEEGTVERIQKSYPHVDLIFGTHNIYKFAELLYERIRSGSMIVDIWDHEREIVEELPSRRKYPYKSGLNIMYGCNNFCSYCIVPYVRGRERSRKPEDILREAGALVNDGVKEIMLLGQNVNSYGKGLDPHISFPELLNDIAKIRGLKRIRFMSSHPKDLSDDLIEVMASNANICDHLHLALQSGSDRILEKMNRHYTAGQYLDIIRKLRTRIPDIAITTDIIVGFPGEEKEDIDATIDVIKEAAFDGAFTFVYSRRKGTPAASMEQLMSDEEIHEGFDRVLKTVQDTAKLQVERFVGRTFPVLVESLNERDESMLTGRIPQNTVVHLKGDKSLIGSIVNVRLDEALGFYYIGTCV